MPSGLKKLDDRVLGSKEHGDDGHAGRRADRGHDREAHDEVYPEERGERGERETRPAKRTEEPAEKKGSGDGLSSFLAVFWRICRLVLLALGLLVLLGAALILLPTNDDNVIVRNVLDLAETVAGPFKDVFNVDDAERQRVYNYVLAAVVYFVLASIVGKLPTGSKKAGS